MQVTLFSEWDGSFPALVAGMPNEIYHSHAGSISNSGLSLVARSPAHYYHAPRSTSSRAQEIGTAFHAALLEPARFDEQYMVVSVDDRRVTAYRDAAKVYGGDKTLTESEGSSVYVMREAVRANDAANEIMTDEGMAELSAFVIDPETGVLMRCRFDWLTVDGVCVDIKKTQDCREWAFSRSLHNYRYHVQAAMYSHIYELLFDRPLQSFKILAIEEQPPCANVLYDIDPLAMQYGHKLYREALEAYAAAFRSGEWGSYSGTGVVTLPEFVLAALDNNEDGVF
jgi:exodeoxyribonuclease VIII